MKLRKMIFILVITISASSQLLAQSNLGKNSLSLSIGTSIPVGNFSKTDDENKFSGYAKAGETVKLIFNYKLTEIIGIEAMAYGQRNALNTNEFEKQLEHTSFFQNDRNYSNWSVEKKTWMIGSVLAGVTGEYAIDQTNKFSIKAKALAGLALVKSPDLEAESRSDNTYATFTGKYGSAKGISILLDAGLNYKLSTHFGLFLNSEF